MSALILRPLVLAVCGAVLTTACGSATSGGPTGGSQPSGAASPTAASPSSARVLQLGSFTYQNHGTRDVRGMDELELEADDFYFGPTFLQGAPGQKLKLEIENEGAVTHNFSLPGQSVDMDIQPGTTTDVEVTFPQSGALRFFCKFHAAQGMNGQLLVAGATPQPVSAPARGGS